MGGTKSALRALKEIGLGTVNGMIDKWRRWALVSVLVAENLALLTVGASPDGDSKGFRLWSGASKLPNGWVASLVTD